MEFTLPVEVIEYVRLLLAYAATGDATLLAGQNTGLPRDIA